MGRVGLLLLAVAGCRFEFELAARDGAGAGADAVTTGDGSGPGADAAAGVWFADGFEDPSFGRWDEWTSGATSTTGPPAPAEGTRILCAETNDPDTEAKVLAVPFGAPLASGEVYVRARYWFPSSYELRHLDFLQIGDATGATIAVQIVTPGPNVELWNEIAGGVGAAADPEFPVPLDQWTCVEAHLVIGEAPGGVFEVSFDGVPRLRMTGADTQSAAGIDHVSLGIAWAHSSQQYALIYVDDVVIDDEPIGCTP